jgi:hypothetical protein
MTELPVDALLLTATRIATFQGDRPLTNASGFFFERDDALFLVTSRHVFLDADNDHHPDRIEIEVHSRRDDLARVEATSLLLYEDGRSAWRSAEDVGGEIDVAMLAIDRAGLPAGHLLRAFRPADLQRPDAPLRIGHPLLIVGFPLGFQDTLHRLPVVRQAVVASAFGLRFQGQGHFLTDGRTHRGISGAAVVAHAPERAGDLPWRLAGVHSARLDLSTRDRETDESLGLNLAWYADVLMTLSEPPAAAQAATAPPDTSTTAVG